MVIAIPVFYIFISRREAPEARFRLPPHRSRAADELYFPSSSVHRRTRVEEVSLRIQRRVTIGRQYPKNASDAAKNREAAHLARRGWTSRRRGWF